MINHGNSLIILEDNTKQNKIARGQRMAKKQKPLDTNNIARGHSIAEKHIISQRTTSGHVHNNLKHKQYNKLISISLFLY